jgi:hypothetical protein
MLAPPQARHFEPGAVATQEGAVDTDSNASRAGEVERKLWLDNIFFCSAAFLERRSPLSASPKRAATPLRY